MGGWKPTTRVFTEHRGQKVKGQGHQARADYCAPNRSGVTGYRNGAIIIIIIIIKNEKIRVTLCENAAGALYIVNKMCVDSLRNVEG